MFTIVIVKHRNKHVMRMTVEYGNYTKHVQNDIVIALTTKKF